MRVLVTGGAGFIGRHVVDELRRRNHVATVADLRTGIDITSPEFLSLPRPDAVIHLAAVHGVPNVDRQTDAAWRTNVFGTWQVVLLAAGAPIVFASSAAVYGDSPDPQDEFEAVRPPTEYGRQKFLGERLVTMARGVSFRLFNVVGEGQGEENGALVPRLLRARREGRPATLYGDASRDFVPVDAVALAFVTAIESDPGLWFEPVLNVCTGHAFRVSAIADILGVQAVREGPRPGDVSCSVGNPWRMNRALGWGIPPEATVDVLRSLS